MYMSNYYHEHGFCSYMPQYEYIQIQDVNTYNVLWYLNNKPHKSNKEKRVDYEALVKINTH
jgi:hypothetical protein